MNYLLTNRDNGAFAVLQADGVIRTIGSDVLRNNFGNLSKANKALENLELGEYFYVGGFVIVGVNIGRTIAELLNR